MFIGWGFGGSAGGWSQLRFVFQIVPGFYYTSGLQLIFYIRLKKIKVAKILFASMLIFYVVMISIWCYRFPISYKLTNGTNHDLVLDHDFTQTEIDGIEKAYHIRQTISNVLLYSSILLSIGFYVVLRNHWIEPLWVVKVVMCISCFIAIVLILVNGIHFIPEPPIR